MNSMFGYRIIEDRNMVIDGDPYEKLRGWKERLFSRPWRPFKKYKTIIPKIPNPEIIVTADCYIMHPEIAKKLKTSLKI